jgi:hypothetical protein
LQSSGDLAFLSLKARRMLDETGLDYVQIIASGDLDEHKIFELKTIDGRQVMELPSLQEIKEYHQNQLSLFWPEYLRKLEPEIYPVDLSE